MKHTVHSDGTKEVFRGISCSPTNIAKAELIAVVTAEGTVTVWALENKEAAVELDRYYEFLDEFGSWAIRFYERV
jgi:hypothetical protein